MTKKLVYGVTAALALSAGAVWAEESDTSIYDTIWGYGTWYDNDDAAVMQKFALTGRLQGDAFSFADDNNNENENIAWRRFRFGFKTVLFQDFTIHAELDGDMNNADSGDTWDDFYNRLTDSYVKWSPSKKAELKVGKQSAGFTLDGATSSKKLIVPERSIVAGNIWFGTEYFTGATLAGKLDNFFYKVGGFSSSGEAEFGHFDSGYFALLSGGMKLGEESSLRLDYIYNDPDYNSDYLSFKGKNAVGTANHEQIVALVYKTMFSEKLGLWADLATTKGIKDAAAGIDMSDLLGATIKPFYNINDNFQVVVEYAGVTSLDNEADVKMSRYAAKNADKKVETSHNLLAGFNWYLYGHKLKWQNAIEYNYGKNLAGTGDDYNGYGVTSALRISW